MITRGIQSFYWQYQNWENQFQDYQKQVGITKKHFDNTETSINVLPDIG
jgi:hypothetical protein